MILQDLKVDLDQNYHDTSLNMINGIFKIYQFH